MEQVDLNGKVLSAIQVEKEKDGRLLTKLFIPQFGFQTIKITKAKLK
jgi:hypothetical protein